MEIVHFIKEKTCLIHMKALTKEDVLQQLAGQLSENVKNISQPTIFKALLETFMNTRLMMRLTLSYLTLCSISTRET